MNTKPKLKKFTIAVIALAFYAVECHAQKEKVLEGIEDLLSLITDSEAARPNGEWKIATAAQATEQLRATKGQQVHLKVKVEKRSKTSIYLPKLRRDGGGNPYYVSIIIHVPSDEPTLLTEVAVGQTIEINGTLGYTSVSYRGPAEVHMGININLPVVVRPAATPDGAPKAVGVVIPVPPAAVAPNKASNTLVPNPANDTALINKQNARIGVLDHPEGISLDPRWDSALSGDSLTLRDLGALLSREAQRGKDTAPHPNLNIYGEVTYLMPLNRAKEVLGLAKRINSKNKMACSGFPASSLYHYSFTGQYEGGYNQLYIVTDKADQVVCIQLVSEHPRSDIPSVKYGDWHVYDFVNARHKSSTALKIGYSIKSSTPSRTSTSTKFNSKTGTRTVTVTKGVKTGATEGASELLNIDIVLRAEDDRCLQTVRWYLPTPLAGLILECIEKQTSAAK